MFPVPPATSMERTGPRVRAKKRDERVLPEAMNAERHGVVHEVIAGCTESNTPRTRPSFDSSGLGTV